MTAQPSLQALLPSPSSAARSDAPNPYAPRRSPWPVTLLVAALVCLTPEIAMLAIDGPPRSLAEWGARAVPVAVGLGVVLTRIRVELAAATLVIALLTVFRSADLVLNGPGPWQTVAALALFAGICWVTCSLGFLLPVRWSVLWMAGLGVATVWALSFDVPITMLGVGWWLVGLTFRHHEKISDRLRQRADELAAEQERFAAEAVRLERARIARELHDVVAHCMTVIVIQARAGRQLAESDAGDAVETLDDILATAREAESDLDSLVGVMEPHRVKPLTRDLLEVIVRRATATGTRVELAVRGNPDALDPKRSAVAHRVVQEALTNALRHAPGAAVALTLDAGDASTDGRRDVIVTVENAAAASLATPTAGSGRGLAGIAERAGAVGGAAHWGTTPSGGWRLVVVLP